MALPPLGGAYALSLRLHTTLRLPIARLGRPQLRAGRYVYCGSAYGPGGLRARILRHLDEEKQPHWHIDHLRRSAVIDGILSVPGGGECDLVRRLAAQWGSSVPVPGFGSSDCRRCAAHLLRIADNLNLDGV